MKVPWVNLLLLILLLIQTVTGYFGMTNGRESNVLEYLGDIRDLTAGHLG